MLDLYEELKTVLAALDAAQVPYALCGGLALAVHGHPRATVDIDLLVPSESIDAALHVLRSKGFEIAALPMTFFGGDVEIHRMSKVDTEAGDLLSVDLLVVTPKLSWIWQSRQTVSWEGSALRVVSREGLIALKKLRGSAQDLADLHAIGGIDES
ncbi:MAG: nucleotidyl transferase AbiEii/AbiGii toxin family protein [Thermoanaerobaculia bacterium]